MNPTAPPPSRAVWLVLAASLACSLAIACAFPLVDPDEGRNAQVSSEMAAGGDVIIPHLAGVPYLDKPPALFVLAAASIRVLGHQPLSARLPAILSTLVTLWLLARAATRLTGEAHAWRAAALTAAAPLCAVIGAYVIFDMPLTACVTAVWTLLACELESGESRSRRALMFLAVGLGILVKGPVMLAWGVGGGGGGGGAPPRRCAGSPGGLVGCWRWVCPARGSRRRCSVTPSTFTTPSSRSRSSV